MIVRFATRFRYAIVGVVAAADGVLDGFSRIFTTSDFAAFNQAGTAILTGHWSNVFSEPWVQVGPLTLVFSGLFSGVHEVLGIRRSLAYSVVVYLVLALGTMFLVRLLYRDRGLAPHPLLELAIGLGTITAGMGFYTIVSGHPSETAIAALWVLAARDAARDKGARSGAWIALAGAFKLWGILGIPLALLARSWRSRAWTVGIAGLGLIALYLPFAFGGKVGTFDYGWNVTSWSPVALILEPGSPFTWSMRVAQGIAVVAVGLIPVVMFRGRREAVWAAPLGVVMARLGTDPLLYNYYWLAAEILALVGIAMLFPKTETWQKVVMIAGFYAVSFVAFVDPIPATVARFGLLLALLVAAYRASPSPPARDRVPGTMTPKAASEFLP